MSPRQLCIHGHFYQPPREDPWLDAILPEGSAAPTANWNRRICEESYAPLAWARRLDGQGRVREIMNCYEYMSFNFGPTLLSWLQAQAPRVYARVLEGDRKSSQRLGHGNALAQIHHHVIMPLATDLDKRAEIAWALADFEARFKRPAEGIWLSEAAVDTRTLELLARAGLRFTILAPRQAREVASLSAEDWTPAHEGNLDIRLPYLVELPGGLSMAVYFYDGPLSQAVAFEGLLGHGDRFWGRLSSIAGQGLLALATDGETYGHHFKFGEMALAFALSQARAGVDGTELTNYAAFLAQNPPKMRVRIHENSSWSCAHGVERWRADCGCATEHKPGWNQAWRAPLRQGLDAVKARLDAHYRELGAGLFRDAEEALVAYGRVLAGLDTQEAFAKAHFRPGRGAAGRDTAWKLLTMQKWALSSFASCAWFFDDLGRIEPMNAMCFALRGLELARATGLEDLEPLFVSYLERARSNDPALGSGADIWRSEILPRSEVPASLCAQALLLLWAEGRLPAPGAEAEAVWPGVSVALRLDAAAVHGPAGLELSASLSGSARIAWARESGGEDCAWSWTPGPTPGDPLGGTLGVKGDGLCLPRRDLPWGKRQAVAQAWAAHAEERAWEQSQALAAPGRALFQSYREAQTTQTAAPRWAALWPALAWLRVLEPGEALAEYDAFLREAGQGHPGRALLEQRLGCALAEALERGAHAEAAALLARARALDLAPDLRPAQELWWERFRSDPAAAVSGEALGLAPA